MRVTPFQFVIACLLIFSVTVICIAPSVNLDPTTLGSQQAGTVAITAVAAAGMALSAVFISLGLTAQGWSLEVDTLHFSSLLDLICSRLC